MAKTIVTECGVVRVSDNLWRVTLGPQFVIDVTQIGPYLYRVYDNGTTRQLCEEFSLTGPTLIAPKSRDAVAAYLTGQL